ncbi:alkaline phosphatase PafA [Flavobacteriaceae bacterium MJ-SS4]|uniref:alkaline phosphatase PafA n=1 Tax=Gilvirhabdus luticola TaxID=3079858 RepID=UPI0032DC9BFE
MKHNIIMVMKRILFYLFIFSFVIASRAQTATIDSNSKPKLVVGIVVDQMRYDYLTRFYNKYGDGGFKRMMDEGYNCKNNHFNYIPTKTGPGHASIFTGTTPKYHGVIGNDWYEKELRRNVNCVDDNSVLPIGTTSNDGKRSPKWMLSTTFADENRLFTQMKGKTIGISIKHRGAILPAGHTANAAYWFDYEHNGTGNWISSSYYMNDLPQWVKDFNDSDAAEKYFKVWNTLYDIDTYFESGNDLNTFERIFKGMESATFPYDLEALKNENGNFQIIADSPFGNSLITDFTLKAIDAEQLGVDEITDILTVSYSSTDKVGHDFGPNSVEVEDTYLRLDLELERLFDALDEKVGKDKYTVFLTSDHGAVDAILYLQSLKIPGGFFDTRKMKEDLNIFLEDQYQVSNLILSRINNQIYLDHDKIKSEKLNLEKLKEAISIKLLEYKLIDRVFIASNINQFGGQHGYLENLLSNGHNQKRSGDILYVYNTSVLPDSQWNRTGTDHGTGYNYDTHVPLLFFGKGIEHGQTFKRTEITDIAPTMSALLGIGFPNASTGNILDFVLKQN